MHRRGPLTLPVYYVLHLQVTLWFTFTIYSFNLHLHLQLAPAILYFPLALVLSKCTCTIYSFDLCLQFIFITYNNYIHNFDLHLQFNLCFIIIIFTYNLHNKRISFIKVYLPKFVHLEFWLCSTDHNINKQSSR